MAEAEAFTSGLLQSSRQNGTVGATLDLGGREGGRKKLE